MNHDTGSSSIGKADLAPPVLPTSRKAAGFLFHYARKHPVGHLIVLGSVLLAVLFSVSTQWGLKRLIDVVAMGPEAGAPLVWGAFGVLCLFIAADNLTWRIGGWAAAHAFVAVTGDVRRDLFAHLAGHSPRYFAERLPGALSARVSATAIASYTVESTTAWNVTPPTIAVFCAILFIGAINVTLAVVLAALALGLGGLIYLLARNGTPMHRDYAEAAAGVDGEMVDVIGNIGVVRAFGATFRERRRLGATIDTEMGKRRRSLLYLEKLRLIHAVLTAFLSAGVVGWGLMLWQRGEASVGDVALMTTLAFTILHGTRDLAVALVDLTQHVARLEEAIGSLLTPHEMLDAPKAPALIPGPGGVVFQDVTFSYPGRAPVMENFNLTIAPGQRVGLVGYSGAGKTTVLALLQRFYDPDKGHVLIDGQDVKLMQQDSLHGALASVPQDIALFHRSVLENLRYGRPDATEEEVRTAAATAQCLTFIEALPQGFDTIVGNRGAKLSGGQRQRVAIARALLKNAPILLLDEATSALDTESEQAIQVALDKLMKGRTVIAIAHRLSTLKSFDRIIVMDRGRIVDDGTPDELSHRPGPYRDLLLKQATTDIG